MKWHKSPQEKPYIDSFICVYEPDNKDSMFEAPPFELWQIQSEDARLEDEFYWIYLHELEATLPKEDK